jgi:hypothetical protein
MDMKPEFGTYTVAMPWYEKEDFEQLLQLAVDRKEMLRDYTKWQIAALSVMNEYLRNGQAIQLVTVRPAEFQNWLSERNLQSTLETRLRYVEYIATVQAAGRQQPERALG